MYKNLCFLCVFCFLALACDAETKSVDTCGDGFLDPGESCDGDQMTVTTCSALGYYDQTDPLTCKADCTYDLSVCTGGRCGDGLLQVDRGEKCDGANLDDQTCSSQGLGGGTLSCKTNCRFEVSRCELAAQCGDNVAASPYEPCDGTDLDDKTCADLGFFGGILACRSDCADFDTSGCSNCGDGRLDDGEACDGSELDGQTCEGLGYSGGVLGCTAACAFDLTLCEVPVSCGNGQLDTGEQCDGTNLDGRTCTSQGFFDGVLACKPNCTFDTSGCTNCGNGRLDGGEACDQSELGGTTCADLGYSPRGGTLSCSAACRFDETACVARSANADLSALTLSDGSMSPVFTPSTTSYSVSLPLEAATLTVTGIAADAPWATVDVSPAQPMALVVGANPATVTVTAEDGTQQAYTVTVTRQTTNDYLSPNIGTLVHVPAGTFQRDATATNLSTVSAFRMSRYEITRSQWVAVTGWADPSTPQYSGGQTDPVQNVSWYDAIAFCNKLSLLEGLTPVYSVSGVDFGTLTYAQIPEVPNHPAWDAAVAAWDANGYRLPTDLEWTWAAMGADTAAPGAVNTTGYAKAFAGSTGINAIGDFAVFGYHTSEAGRTLTERTNQVGSKLANELGIHDLSGNIAEWVWDWYGTVPAGTLTDYRGPASGTERAAGRGSGWGSSASYCTVTFRYAGEPSFRFYTNGLRVVRR